MILVDANIWMYALGTPDPHQSVCQRFLERVVDGQVQAAVSVEVLHEILHRYRSIARWEHAVRVYQRARVVVPVILPVDDDVLQRACELLAVYPRLMTRDAIHAATVQAHGLDAICSYDRDLDGIEGLVRVEP